MELASQVENLTKAIQSLPSLLDAVSSLPLSGWLVLVAFFLWLLANKNLPLFLDLLERTKKRRLEQIETYVSSPDSGDANTIEAVRDIRDAQYFKIATGIYAERRIRNAYIRLHKSTSHLITWRHIFRAHPYLQVDSNETVTVRDISFWERLVYWYNQLIAYFFLLVSAALASLLILSESNTLTSVYLGIGGGILSALFATFIFSLNLPVDAAKKIASELDAQRSAGTDA